MFYFRIGFRNIIKNYKRSLITMVSIIIGMTACLLTQGFFNWNMSQLTEATIHSGTGHYQLYARGFSQFGSDDPYQYLIKDVTPIVAELERLPEIEMVTTRMSFSGILSSGAKSTVIIGEAGNPEKETRINNNLGIVRGTNLSSEKPDGLMVGTGVAEKLSAKLGDTLTLLGNTKDGGLNAVDLDVVGLTQKGYSDLDNMSAATSLDVIQDLLNLDNSVQRLVILLKDTGDTKRILPEIIAISEKYNLEYLDWENLAEFYQSLKLMYDVVFYIVIVIVLAIIIFTISNTVNMSLNDRVREIGTMRALGTRRFQVALVFIVESFLNGIIGGLLGLVTTYLFISFTKFTGGLPILINETEVRIFFQPKLIAIIWCMVLFSLVAVIAALIPSYRASKISITQALRWI